MSLYRVEMQMGILSVTKRKLFRWWKWSFNRSLEDPLIKARNRLASLNTEVRTLRRIVPRLELELKTKKEKLQDMGGVSPPWTDSWSLRRRPTLVKEPVPRKKVILRPVKDPVLFQATVPVKQHRQTQR